MDLDVNINQNCQPEVPKRHPVIQLPAIPVCVNTLLHSCSLDQQTNTTVKDKLLPPTNRHNLFRSCIKKQGTRELTSLFILSEHSRMKACQLSV